MEKVIVLKIKVNGQENHDELQPKEINDLLSQGYKVKSVTQSSSGGSTYNHTIVTFVLEN